MLAQLAFLAVAALSTPTPDPGDSAVTLIVGATRSLAMDRLIQAFTAEGVAVTGSEGGVVTGAGREKLVDIRYVASVVSLDSAKSLITLSAFAKNAFMPAPYSANERRVTSKLKGGDKVWARLQRLAEAVQKSASTPPP
jgi:hypothetical protein